jgi:cytochrome c-type biogenesis protein CcmH/NrfG
MLLKSWGRDQIELERCKASLDDIAARLKQGQINEAEADAARLALLTQSPTSPSKPGPKLPITPKMLFVAFVVLFPVAGLGAAVSLVETAPEAARAGESMSFSGPDGELLTRLADYARSIETGQASPAAPSGELLPDVNEMIKRLATRLEAAPQDLDGWRMLGWSYFQTDQYDLAAAAFKKALELDPNSTELKLSYEEASAKASESANVGMTPSLPTPDSMKVKGQSGERVAAIQAMPEPERDAAIRSMVDGLASRLASSPQDVDGWIQLMRSRVVLGEVEVAATTFRKALEVFANDIAASGKITAAAVELGLKSQ